MQAFQRDLEKFEKLGAQVLGVSSDSIDTHTKFSKQYNFMFPLLSDEKKIIKKLYGTERITYLIDKNGIVRFIQTGVPNNDDFLRALEKLESNLQKN